MDACANKIFSATTYIKNWEEICGIVVNDAMQTYKDCGKIDKEFKITCAVFKHNNFQYHSSMKKSRGSYYEFVLTN